MTTRAHNFNAGPAALPLEVLQTAAQEMTNFAHTGMSVMELSHRSASYEAIHQEAQTLIRDLYGLDDEFVVLFLQGGASTQFAMVPMHALGAGQTAAYVVNGSWGAKAYAEAKSIGDAVMCASTKADGYRDVPAWDDAWMTERTAYVHITTNETIEGVQWSTLPTQATRPLIADMSSDILSRPMDVRPFSLIYAGAQKNLGPSGVTVVIARRSFLAQTPERTLPTMLRYDTHVSNNSLYNTPPTFAIYVMTLVLRWIVAQGGLPGIAAINEAKAKLIYDAIDESNGFYQGHATISNRSRMNITFRLPDADREKAFLQKAKEQGFIGLAGHRSVGGCRASTYNAVTTESCAALATLMRSFARQS